MREYPETHQKGLISFEQDIKAGGIKGDFGIQVAKDGRVWICVDGEALLRFKPLGPLFKSKLTLPSKGKDNGQK